MRYSNFFEYRLYVRVYSHFNSDQNRMDFFVSMYWTLFCVLFIEATLSQISGKSNFLQIPCMLTSSAAPPFFCAFITLLQPPFQHSTLPWMSDSCIHPLIPGLRSHLVVADVTIVHDRGKKTSNTLGSFECWSTATLLEVQNLPNTSWLWLHS